MPDIIDQEESIKVVTHYLPEQSDDKDSRYVFSYTITITNNTDQTFQVMSRYWLITDANGDTSTVEGEGIVGKQPHINPGKSYTYTSGCFLQTPVGTMQGYYQAINENKETTILDIPVFQLAQPNIVH
jgi:ApaG protein